MMILLAISGGVLLSLAIIVRELTVSRERASALRSAESLENGVAQLRSALERTQDDLTVLRTTLEARNVVDEKELARTRARLIDSRRRRAIERGELTKVEIESELVSDDGESVH